VSLVVNPMQTALITIALPLPVRVAEIHSTIESALSRYGEPLRWAITTLDPLTRIAQIEAVVTSASASHSPAPL